MNVKSGTGKKLYYDNERGINYLMILFTIAASSFVINMLIRGGLSLEFIAVNNYDIKLMHETDIRIRLLEVSFARLKQLVIIIFLMHFFDCTKVYGMLSVILGIGIGVFLSVQCCYMGIQGMNIFLLSVLPHYIFYVLIIKALYNEIKWKKSKRIYVFLFVTMMFLAGLACEVFFSEIFLYKYFQYIVFT